MIKILLVVSLLLIASNAFAAYTVTSQGVVSAPTYLTDTNLTSSVSVTAIAGRWLSVDLGSSVVFSSLLLFSGITANTFPSDFDIQVSSDICLTYSAALVASWVTVKTFTGVQLAPTSPFMVGFDVPISARSIRLFFNNNPSTGSFSFAHLSLSSLTSDAAYAPTFDMYQALLAINSDTNILKASITDLSTLITSGGGSGGSPLDQAGSAAALAVPVDLVPLIKPTDFAFASGLSGLLCGFTILLIWSRGL